MRGKPSTLEDTMLDEGKKEWDEWVAGVILRYLLRLP